MTDKYSLKMPSTYVNNWNITYNSAKDHYKHVLFEYTRFIGNKYETMNLRSKPLFTYIIVSGLETITHVFKFILLCTGNLDAAVFYAQNSTLLYVEFMTQIKDNTNVFLKLSVRDAIVYVYKKSIFQLRSSHTETHCTPVIDAITEQINVYKKNVIQYIINLNDPKITKDDQNKIEEIVNGIPNLFSEP